MRALLVIFAFLAALMGAAIFAGAKSAVHEIEAFVLFLIAATLFTGAAIANSLLDGRARSKSAETALSELQTLAMAQLDAIKEISKTISAIEAGRHELPPVIGQDEFFVSTGEGVEGPVSRAQLAELLNRGTISSETLVIQRGGKEWRPLEQLTAAR